MGSSKEKGFRMRSYGRYGWTVSHGGTEDTAVGSSKERGFRMRSYGRYGWTVSHGGTCLTLRLRQAGGGGYPISIQMCFDTKKHNLSGSTVRQHWEKIGIAAKRKKTGGITTLCLKILVGFRCDCPAPVRLDN